MRFHLFILLALELTIISCESGTDRTCIIKQDSSVVKVVMNEKNGICTSLSSYLCRENSEIRISDWKLNYPTYHFECADVDGEGTDDVLVGVIKSTRFDPLERKRIFIFKVLEGHIRPLWLGSRVSQPLEDFKATKRGTKNMIRTIESEHNGKFLVAEYQWKGFGLTFIRYIERNLGTDSARIIFNTIIQDHENS